MSRAHRPSSTARCPRAASLPEQAERAGRSERPASTNLILGSTELYAQLAAFDPDWNAAVPYTLLIRPDGTIAYKAQSTNVDPLKLKRLIIANLADDDYIGHQAYWKSTADARK